MKINKFKEKITLHPIMTILILTGIIIILSGILSVLGVQATFKKISPTTLEYNTYVSEVTSLFNLSGLKYIFTSTVSNFISFAPLSGLIIILIGISVMEKSGFLKVAITILTKNLKKTTVTFLLVLVSIIVSFIGDLSFIIMMPIASILFLNGKRNPHIGIIASFAGLTCGYGLSVIFTSLDSSLLSLTNLAANIVNPNYDMRIRGWLYLMIFTIIIMSIVITNIVEKHLVYKLEKYEFLESEVEEEFTIGKKEKKGITLAFTAFFIYFFAFLYNIVPGLPFSGKLLDNSQVFYIDKLFSYNSFFNKGFVFIVTMGFVILGFFYGIGAKTIKNNRDLCENLSHSLDDIGVVLVSIFFASVLVNVFKYTNIGNVITAGFSNLISETEFTSIPLIILLFIITAISTIFLPSSIARWSILSGVTVPIFMRNGMSPEFVQVIFRFGESVTVGSTPFFAYFILYLAWMSKYNQSDKPVGLLKAIKYMLPFNALTFVLLLTILIGWYIVGIPIGIGVTPTL